MVKGPLGRGYNVPGTEVSDAVQRAAESCGLQVNRNTRPYGVPGSPSAPRLYDEIKMTYSNGKNWLGLPKKETTTVLIDPQATYATLASVNIPHKEENSPFYSVHSKLLEMQNERASGYKR